jgi:hypothetical protein
VSRRNLANGDGSIPDFNRNASISFLAPQQMPVQRPESSDGAISKSFIPAGPTDLAKLDGTSGSAAIKKARR